MMSMARTGSGAEALMRQNSKPLVPSRPTRAPVIPTCMANKKPSFHLQPVGGWLNDPNGVHYDDKTKMYHMFFQHHPKTSQWSWGLSWGHAVSEDLVHWSHLPPALDPTPEGPDSGGVFSGCAFPTDEGTVLLHTAVRKRDETPESKLPPADYDLGHQIIESQQFAVSQPGKDPFLREWSKGEELLLPLPPQANLTGWRDPFLVGRPGDGVHDKYTMIIGSGYKADPERNEPAKGACFVYTSDNPIRGWKLDGELCHGDGKTGHVWECPLLARVNNHPDFPGQGEPNQYMLVVCPDNPHNTPLYFLGNYDPTAKKFDIDNASGPHPLDLGGGPLGSTFYAPNVLNNDPHGRLIMWGWCQETGRPGDPALYDYGSCLSVPRMIWRHPYMPGVIWQEPLPSLSLLRRSSWYLSGGDQPNWTKINFSGSPPNATTHPSSNRIRSSLDGTETTNGAKDGSTAVNGSGASANGSSPFANGDGVSINGDGVSMNGDGVSMNGNGVSMNGDGVSMNGDGVSMNGDGVSMNGNGVSMNGNGASANGNGAAAVNGNSAASGEDGHGGHGMPVPESRQANSRVNLKPGYPVYLPSELGSHPHLELELTLEPPAELPPKVAAKTGIIIRSNEIVPMTAHEASGRNGAALLYDWRHARLEVVFSDGAEDLETLCAAPAATYDRMNATSRVYLDFSEAEAGEEQEEEQHRQCEHNDLLTTPCPVHNEHASTGSAAGLGCGDMDADHHPLDVRGCHAVGGQLRLFPQMTESTGSKNTAAQPGAGVSKAAVGGVLQPIKLRVFLDHSMLEAFTSTGQVLTTRVYHHETEDHPSVDEDDAAHGSKQNKEPSAQSQSMPVRQNSTGSNNGFLDLPPSLELVSFGVDSGVSNVAGYMLAPIWHGEEATGEMEARAKDNFGQFSRAGSARLEELERQEQEREAKERESQEMKV